MNNIQILEAYYGSCNINAIDVTEQVRKKVDNANTTVSILVDPTTFNIPDPDSGVKKSLTIVFSYGTSSDLILSKSGVDGTTLNLNLSANQFEITSATYGTNLTFIDIKDKLNSFTVESLKNTQLAIGSGEFLNRFCGGTDIAPNVPKTLTVSFTVRSQKVNVCANDGQIFDFLKDY